MLIATCVILDFTLDTENRECDNKSTNSRKAQTRGVQHDEKVRQGIQTSNRKTHSRRRQNGGAGSPGNGLHENTLYRWVAEFKSNGAQAFPGSGQLKPEDKALRTLQKRIRDLEEENEILKKAMHYFAKDRR